MTETPEALSSAPGETATESRCAPMMRYGFDRSSPGGSATMLDDKPASTGTPHESPAGTRTSVRRMSYPRPARRRFTNRAACRNPGEVASRVPMRLASRRTSEMTAAGSNAFARGASVVSVDRGSAGVDDPSVDESDGDTAGSGPSPSLHPASRTSPMATVAIRHRMVSSVRGESGIRMRPRTPRFTRQVDALHGESPAQGVHLPCKHGKRPGRP